MYYPNLFNDEFSGMFDEVLSLPFSYGKRLRNEVLPKKRCTTDIKEYDDKYELEIELPGYDKSDVKAELKSGYLVVTAEHTETKETTDTQEQTAETEAAEVVKPEPKYLCRERFYGKCERSFYVGKEVTKEDIKAQFTNGILTITVPKVPKKQEDEKEFISILD